MRFRAMVLFAAVVFVLTITTMFQAALPAPITNAATSPFGYLDDNLPYFYNPSSATKSLVQTPTGEKPQSKLWFNDGRWWGSIFNKAAGNYHIYWLNLVTQRWADTGTVLDTRAQTKADCLWDGTHLYVASGGGADPIAGNGTSAPLPGYLYRYSYNTTTKQYTKDAGPVLIRNGGAETLVIDKDTTGRLWITYTQNGKVYVNHSRSSDIDWDATAAIVVPTPDPKWTSVSPDDISTLVAFDTKIGILWSNESPGQLSGSSDTAFYFAYHVDSQPDTSWTSGPIFHQPSVADDHLNIKALQSDPAGNLYAMVKTSFNSAGTPQLVLLVGKKINGSYNWSWYTESIREEGQTRPLLVIDTSHRTLYVFTSTEGGGSIYYKSTSMDNIKFPTGADTARTFMSKPGYAINDVTSTKQTANSASGIVVLASHDNESSVDSTVADFYFHNYIDLNTSGATLTPTASRVPTATLVPTATPTLGPVNTNRQVFVPVSQN
ncbi:MAG: hypothetical protein IPP13_16290 [Kouleothrix sp.]|nr:hypothetical protein [Kouleothrix sp.]